MSIKCENKYKKNGNKRKNYPNTDSRIDGISAYERIRLRNMTEIQRAMTTSGLFPTINDLNNELIGGSKNSNRLQDESDCPKQKNYCPIFLKLSADLSSAESYTEDTIGSGKISDGYSYRDDAIDDIIYVLEGFLQRSYPRRIKMLKRQLSTPAMKM